MSEKNFVFLTSLVIICIFIGFGTMKKLPHRGSGPDAGVRPYAAVRGAAPDPIPESTRPSYTSAGRCKKWVARARHARCSL